MHSLSETYPPPHLAQLSSTAEGVPKEFLGATDVLQNAVGVAPRELPYQCRGSA